MEWFSTRNVDAKLMISLLSNMTDAKTMQQVGVAIASRSAAKEHLRKKHPPHLLDSFSSTIWQFSWHLDVRIRRCRQDKVPSIYGCNPSQANWSLSTQRHCHTKARDETAFAILFVLCCGALKCKALQEYWFDPEDQVRLAWRWGEPGCADERTDAWGGPIAVYIHKFKAPHP